jgi:fructoselysine-6-P-deglycase FrlB-like protein
MRSVVVFRDNTDYSREVTDYLRDFEKQTGRKLDTIDPDTEAGAHFCETYDIVEYPTVIALSDASVMQNIWRGLPLPTIIELSYYVE